MTGQDPIAALPAKQRDAARAAIDTVLGSVAALKVGPITGGVSGAIVLRIETVDHRFVLRIEGPAGSLRNPHQYASMRIAAAAGIAPPVHYLNADDRVVMIDFVEDRPLETYPGGQQGLAEAIGTMLRNLQGLPAFPYFVDYPDQVERLWTHVCGAGLFADGLLDAASQKLADIRSVYALDIEKYRSSHNDLLPRNVLFDGKRLWLIDWENSYRNDPLIDLAAALDNFAPSAQLEEMLMQAWLGAAPDHHWRERLALARSLTRLFYAGVLFSASAAAGQATSDIDLSAPSAAEFEHAIRAGRLKPETAETSHVLGKMFLASFLSGDKPPGLPPMYMR
jgi:aminoglycoside phosphotransferase (APT) family kinase protein